MFERQLKSPGIGFVWLNGTVCWPEKVLRRCTGMQAAADAAMAVVTALDLMREQRKMPVHTIRIGVAGA